VGRHDADWKKRSEEFYGKTMEAAPFLFFVNRIAPLMRPGTRLLSLSSSGHRFSDVDLDYPNFERTPVGWHVEPAAPSGIS
jgi:hypothetical protein